MLRDYRINFITETFSRIRLDNAKEWSVSASIRPHKDREEDDKAKLRAFQPSRNRDELESIITEASQLMGVGEEKEHNPFSRDVLQIAVKGPDTRRLTLVDVPGLISVNIKTDTDIATVQEITHSYIEKSNAIILAVVNADADPQLHGILEMAIRVDPSAERTFGIITKPDLQADNSIVDSWLKILQDPGNSKNFKKGAHVLLNGSSDQTNDPEWSPEKRDHNEGSFFEARVYKIGPNAEKENRWNVLHEGKLWGIKSLRERLADLLFEHAHKQFPNLRRGIEKCLHKYKVELRGLEGFLKDPETLEQELQKKMGKMASTTDHGSKGTFATYDGFFDFHENRWLRSQIRDDSKEFKKKMDKKGHDTEFAWAPDSETPEDVKQAVEKYFQIIQKTRGPELTGNVDSIKLTLLFNAYSKDWGSYAQDYVEAAYDNCCKFIQEVAKFYMWDVFTADRLHETVLNPLLKERKDLAMKELTFLEEDRQGPAITEDDRFWMENSEQQRKRFIEMSKKVEKLQLSKTDDPKKPPKPDNSKKPKTDDPEKLPKTDDSEKLPKTDDKDAEILRVINQDTEEAVQRKAALSLIRQMVIYYKVRSQRKATIYICPYH